MNRGLCVLLLFSSLFSSSVLLVQANYNNEIAETNALQSSSEERSDEEQETLVEEPTSVTERAVCLGCEVDANQLDPKIQEIVAFAFKTYLDKAGDESDVAQSLVRVLKAKTQVVAGIKYILDLEVGWTTCKKAEFKNDPEQCPLDTNKDTFVCNFEIVEQAWLKQTEVVSSKCHELNTDSDDVQYKDTRDDTDEKEEIHTRQKREALAISSSSNNVDNLNDNRTFLNLAKFAVQQLDRIDEDTKARFAVAVISGRKEMVNVPGWLYHLKIRVAHTDCPEESDKSYEECSNSITLPYHICQVKILFQPWQTVQSKMTESQCYPEKYRGRKMESISGNQNEIDTNEIKKSLIGGFTPVDPTSESILKLADFAVVSLDGRLNSLHAQKVVRVVEARKQIVNGIKTKLSLELGYTTCRKHSQLDRSTCNFDSDREHQMCHVTVWEQPWKNSTKVTNAKCGKLNSGNERQSENMQSRARRATLFSFSDMENSRRAEFGAFMEKYKKSYNSTEETEYSLKIFNENMKKVKVLQDTEEGTATYGATIFADLTEEEFANRHLGLKPSLRRTSHRKKAKIPPLVRIPDEFDWRHYNIVTPVKNQGYCGSCWAFSVTGNIEGAYALKHKQLVSFSEQELVDCDTLDEGCNGGLPENAYKSLEKLGGLESETAYPYDGRGEKCHFDYTKAQAKVTGFVEVPKNETEMAMWLVKRGPMSIGINANAMQFYFGGVSHPWKFLCSPKSLDHGVLIVGYGVHTQAITKKLLPYWIVKNSWGPHWGEQGYYRVFRGQNTCGVSEMVTSATVA